MTKCLRRVFPDLFVLGLIVGGRFASAAAGSLDPTFGNRGVTVTSFAGSAVIPYSIKLQADGKILVLVNGSVLRYTSAGSLDPTFGGNGIAVLPTAISTFGSMVVQANGQIVVAGEVTDPANGGAAFGLQRLNSNGGVDTTFGTGGLAVANMGFPGVQAVLVIEPNNDILLCGQLEPTGRHEPFQTALARFNASGDLDPNFGNGGTVAAPAVGGCSALAVLSTGEILVENGPVVQLMPNGVLESTVTGGTIVASAGTENPSTVGVFQPNGHYLAATVVAIGAARGHNFAAEVLRFTVNGSQDTTFANPVFRFDGTGGSGVEDVPNEIALQPNGDIVVVGLHSVTTRTGTITVNALARLTSSGSFDSTFGINGIVTNSVPAGTQGLQGVVIQTDGNIVVVGTANNNAALTVSRYLGQ